MQIKRRLSSSEDEHHPQDALSKRRRITTGPDILTTLSDELLVRILSFMDETSLLDISRVSHRFQRITSDSQLWRPHYYRRFILPRAHRIPGFSAKSSSQHYTTQTRKHMSNTSRKSSVDFVDWKKQYKLRHNWARGRCAVEEMPVHAAAKNQWQTLVKVVDGLAVTADSESGLRAWDLHTKQPIAQIELGCDDAPTCISVKDDGGDVDVAVGFYDGTFAIWRLDTKQDKFSLRYRQTKSFFGNLVSIAYRYPYVLTATRLGFISVYTFDYPEANENAKDDDTLPAPYIITSLKSHSTRSPLALSLRQLASSVVASIAYTFDTAGGWSIGVQDLEISSAGIVTSRIASTLPTQTRSSASTSTTPSSSPIQPRSPAFSSSENHIDDGPTRLSYNHPYLLATLPDNTLSLHLCNSTDKSLSISPGMRLWGHTSGISDADITPRGKAVSVSTRGNEIRLWELEGKVGGSSVTVRPRQPDADEVVSSASEGEDVQLDERKNWVGFDEKMVIVLKEAQGRDSLMVYDFT